LITLSTLFLSVTAVHLNQTYILMYYEMHEIALGLESWNLNSVVGLVASGPTDFIKSRFRECETIRNGI